MPRGQDFEGHWNFHVRRHQCPNCGKKGLYKSHSRGWIICMYCKLMETLKWTPEYKKLNDIINEISIHR